MRSFLLFVLFGLSVSFASAQVLGVPLYTWDFADGIPSGFVNGSASGISQWEYRGPNTVPDNTVASRGSCGSVSVPIASQTLSNGFVIFDSNYWDDDDNQCGGLGTGQDPAPHDAWLITEPISLSGVTGAILTFQQQFRIYSATTKVQISTDGGGSWADLIVNSGFNSPSAEWKSVSLTPYLGQTDIRFKFSFVGTYYHWCLDDITIFQPNINDVAISNVKYSQFGNVNVDFPLDMEYDQYPQIMIPAFNFTCAATNIGSALQNSVQLTTRIKNSGGTTIYTATSTSPNIGSGSSATLTAGGAYTPTNTLGDFNISYTIAQMQIDENLLNNSDTLDYSITPYSYARDEGPMEDVFVPQGIYNGQHHQIGNFFQARGSGLQFASVAVAVGPGTLPGTVIQGIVYDGEIADILGVTESYTVNVADINALGEEKMITLPFATPIILDNDSIYTVMVGNVDASQALRVCRSGKSPDQTSYVKYPDSNGLFFLLKTPVVRMNIFAANAIPGCTNSTAMNFNNSATINDGSCDFPGCTAPNAENYNPAANFDDGSCILYGCTLPMAVNYDPLATIDDGSCIILGCMNPLASNFDPFATQDDGSCTIEGCTNPLAANYNSEATTDDGSCQFPGCTNPIASNYDPMANVDNGTCILYGCTNSNAMNYDANANTDDGSCIILGCTDPTADNYDPQATQDDESCYYLGCMDPGADNYDPNASIDDGSCYFLGCTDPLASNYDETATQEDGSCVYSFANFNVSVTEGCSPLVVTVTNLTDVIVDGSCSFDDGNGNVITDCLANFDITYSNPGDYTITYTYNSGTEITQVSSAIHVYEHPAIPLLTYFALGNLNCTQCAGNDLIWNVDDLLFSNSDATSISTYNGTNFENGMFTVISTNEWGCSSSSDDLFVFQAYVSEDIDFGCAPLTVTYSDLTDPVAGMDCQIEIEGVLQNINESISHIYAVAGNYDAILQCSANGSSSSFSIPVQVNPIISPILEIDPVNLIVNCTNWNSNYSITWIIDGQQVATDVGSYDLIYDAVYQVILVSEGSCTGAISETFTSIAQNGSPSMSLYPNPANTYCRLSSSEIIDWYEIRDTAGRLLQKGSPRSNQAIIETAHLDCGTYTITSFNNQKPATTRLVILK